jgi:hypothetical protein
MSSGGLFLRESWIQLEKYFIKKATHTVFRLATTEVKIKGELVWQHITKN